ncbi:MAG TPA: PEP-CTERM sorting domain-containing protein [Candidatus Limnocylindrales bacterium]|nr:PEP-CTERM sorting domain-containing protein [Candidatus Limnocylindrales bacterium]
MKHKIMKNPTFKAGLGLRWVAGALAVLGTTAAQANMTPISAFGWNADGVIQSPTVDPQSTLLPYNGNWAYYSTTAPGAPAGTGIALGTSFTSVYDGTTVFQFQPAGVGSPNVIGLQAQGSTTPSGSLFLASPKAYTELSLLGTTSVNGGLTYPTVTINYGNGAPSQSLSIPLPNWNSASTYGNVALNLGYYVGQKASAGYTFVGPFGNPFSLYQMNITPSDTTDPIESITIESSTYGGDNAEQFFALSGQVAVPEPATFALAGLGALALICGRRLAGRRS